MRHFLLPLAFLVVGAALAKSHPSMRESLDFWIANTEREIVPAAEAMPASAYEFAPTSGEFHGVRTFAEQVKHLAANNYRTAARMLSQQPTADQESESGPASVQSKSEIVAYLKGSFAALHRAVAAVTPENALAPITFKSSRPDVPYTRVWFVIDAVAHSYDHYGQMVEYLRMKGVIPPASR